MSMSKKDYEMVADTLAATFINTSARSASQSQPMPVKWAMEDLSDAFQKANPRFQPETFKARFDQTAKTLNAATVRKVGKR